MWIIIFISLQDVEGKSPLHCAIENGHQTIINMLLEQTGLELCSRDKSGLTPFATAMSMKNNRYIQWRNFYYWTLYGPIIHFLVTFYFLQNMRCDQKAEYGTIKSSIVRIYLQSIIFCTRLFELILNNFQQSYQQFS